MKKSKLVKRNQIVILYQYFLFRENDSQFTDFLRLNTSTRTNSANSTSGYQQDLSWFNDFRRKKHEILALIGSNLKSGWRIERIPVFEKSIIVSAVYTIQSQENVEKKQLFSLVDQTISFSKKYLEKDKCGYINKLLDLVAQARMKTQISAQQEQKLESLPV